MRAERTLLHRYTCSTVVPHLDGSLPVFPPVARHSPPLGFAARDAAPRGSAGALLVVPCGTGARHYGKRPKVAAKTVSRVRVQLGPSSRDHRHLPCLHSSCRSGATHDAVAAWLAT